LPPLPFTTPAPKTLENNSGKKGLLLLQLSELFFHNPHLLYKFNTPISTTQLSEPIHP
jgi:hypothetical protein